MGNATGPRTPKGKTRSSQNAAKHWIESGRILPLEQKEAGRIRHGLVEYFKPDGGPENEVIDDIVLNRLIRRRTDVAFTREFSKASALKPLTCLEKHEGMAIPFYSRGRYGGEYGTRARADLCIYGLEVLTQRIKERGLEPAHNFSALSRLYGRQPTEHAAALLDGLERIVGSRPTEAADLEERKKWALDVMELEISLQKSRLDVATDLEDIEVASDIQEPDSPALETLLRYRAANTRELKDLLDTLERMRRLRGSAA
jgi:hypothetical protein